MRQSSTVFITSTSPRALVAGLAGCSGAFPLLVVLVLAFQVAPPTFAADAPADRVGNAAEFWSGEGKTVVGASASFAAWLTEKGGVDQVRQSRTFSHSQNAASGVASTWNDWPWRRWHRYRIAPRFEYRQVIHVGPPNRPRARTLDLRTRYRYETRSASWARARVDVVIEGIDVYRRGRYLGTVDRLPRQIRRTRAQISRGGRVSLDREIAVIGAPGAGYELLALEPSTYWGRPRVLAVARVQLRRQRAIPVRRSRLLHTRRTRHLAPIPILPPDLGRVDDRHGYNPVYDNPWRDRYEDRYEDRYDRYDERYERRYERRYEDRDDRRERRYDRRSDRYEKERDDDDRAEERRRERYNSGRREQNDGRSERAARDQNRRSRTWSSTPNSDEKTVRSTNEQESASGRGRSATTGRSSDPGREREKGESRRTIRSTKTDTIGQGDDAVRVERETELRRLDNGRSRAGRGTEVDESDDNSEDESGDKR